jgi:hypothetical protein
MRWHAVSLLLLMVMLLVLVQVRWSNATPGLPLRVDICTRRFNFLKKHHSSSLFIASLEAQVRSSALMVQRCRVQVVVDMRS